MTIDHTFAAFTARLMDFMSADPTRQDPNDAQFTDLARELFELQFRHVRVFRAFCEAQGVRPGDIRSWRDIPAVATRAFQSFDLSSLGKGDHSHFFLSSGTTSQSRSRHYHSHESLRIYEESLTRWFGPHLLPDLVRLPPRESARPLRLLVLTPAGREAPHSSLVHMFETVARRYPFKRPAFVGFVGDDGAWHLDMGRTEAFLQECIDGGEPTLVLGTAFSFVHLLDFFTASGRQMALPCGSRAMETGGYKGRSRALARSELHALITAKLGISADNIVSEYGMSELSSQAYDHVVGSPDELARGPNPVETRSLRLPPWARFRIISPETGEEADPGQTGILQLFDLANVYSVMAVQTDDLGVQRGSGFELQGRAVAAPERGCSLMTP